MFCDQAKAYLSQKGVPFVERNIMAERDALAELQAMNLFTTPVITIGNEVIVGFDRAKIDRALDVA